MTLDDDAVCLNKYCCCHGHVCIPAKYPEIDEPWICPSCKALWVGVFPEMPGSDAAMRLISRYGEPPR